MCGIAGIISNDSIIPEWLYGMSSVLRHRGPDDEGYTFFTDNGVICLGGNSTPSAAYEIETDYRPLHKSASAELRHAQVAFAHRRLAIVDLSALGHQPMSYLSRYWLVYNGEIYNHQTLREELKSVGYTFYSDTDTEVILAAYDYWGTDCQSHFNGMWSMVLYDIHNKILLFSRDRFGVKPLYYWISPVGFLAFASEIKAFTTLPGWKAVGNCQRIYDYLVHSVLDHTDETMFTGVYQISPGCYSTLGLDDFARERFQVGGRINVQTWYALAANQFNGEGKVAAAKFKEILSDSVRLRLNADVPVGSCLSGGLDSSSVVCLVNNILRLKGDEQLQRTYSACTGVDGYDERYYIDIVVKDSGVNARYIYPDGDTLPKILPDLVWHQDEPFISTSISAQWAVFQCAAESGTKVMLDGQGADELLAGYHTFFGPYLAGLTRRLRPVQLWSEWRAIHALHGYGLCTLLKWVVGYNLPARMRKKIIQIANKKIIQCLKLTGVGPISSLPHSQYGCSINSLAELSSVQLASSNLPMLLHWEDRNSMAHSVEARVPFLDYRLVEFVLGLPDELKIKDGVTKVILREGMRGVLPEEIRLRYDKLAFATPEALWFKGDASKEFRKLLRETLAEIKIINLPEALHLFDSMASGEIPYDSSVWRLICFGAWCKRFDVSV